MARTTKSVSRARTAELGAFKKGAGKRAAARGGGAEAGAVKRGASKRGAIKRRSRAALDVKGWTVNFVSGESLQLEADSVSIDSSGTATFSLFGNDVLYVSAANYNFIMETSEPLERSEEDDAEAESGR
jgi:hypothetical protein